jgi:hypothetical protein
MHIVDGKNASVVFTGEAPVGGADRCWAGRAGDRDGRGQCFRPAIAGGLFFQVDLDIDAMRQGDEITNPETKLVR